MKKSNKRSKNHDENQPGCSYGKRKFVSKGEISVLGENGQSFPNVSVNCNDDNNSNQNNGTTGIKSIGE